MYIKDVIMEGFKCYSERTVIKNLDRSFTAITGMNGSGKSNIIDAIIFALDLSSPKFMRVSTLKELINIHRRECSVTIVFNNSDKSSSPSGYEHYDELEISRSMDHEAKSKYKINSHSSTKATIEKLCKSIGITNDFIVMQGHITKILNMKPVELKHMTEEAAGTRTYNDEKEKSKELLDRKEIKLKEAQEHLKRKISPFFKELMTEKKIYEENREFESTRMQLVEELQRLEEMKNMHNITDKVNELEDLLQSYSVDKQELKNIESKLKEINEAGTEEDLVELKTKINEEMMRVEDLTSAVTESALRSKEEELKAIRITGSQYNKQHLLDRESILSKELCNNFSMDKISELESLKSKEIKINVEVSQLYKDIQMKSAEISENIANCTNGREILGIIKQVVNEKNKDKAFDLIRDFKDLINTTIQDVENNLSSKQELDKKIQYLKSKLVYPMRSGVHGTVDELFDLKDDKYKEAIFTVLGGRSKYIICENDDIAAELLKTSDRKISCIPLNKISCNEARRLNTSGINAVDAIRFDRKYVKAFEHLFGGFYIFNSKEEASKCCFANKVLCITLDGTIYDPKGTLTGGKSSFNIEITRRSDIDTIESKISELAKAIPEEYEVNRLRNIKYSLEQFEKLFICSDDNKNKIILLEKICNGKFDIKSELEMVRKEIVEASKEESMINKEKQRADRLEKQISELKSTRLSNDKQISESMNKLSKYQSILKEEELRNNNRRVSVRMVEGFDLKRKNLIKSTVKASSRINKLNEEIRSLDINTNAKSKKCNQTTSISSKENINNYQSADYDELVQDFDIDQAIFSITKKPLTKEELNALDDRIVHIKDEVSKKRTRNTMDPKSFEVLEKNAAVISELEEKIQQLEKDKQGIVRTIEELSKLGQKENKKAFDHINENIGKFLRYFLPGADAKISSDFEIKVKIGDWKNSLAELSGGQRSLIALCLIFSMLTYKPAPFYIFDEIDAALDLNYTQRIGEVIHNEFSNAQFVVVSLKNNMFDNANRIFKVFIQDQKSKICQIK